MVELLGLPYSPWSERARWALDARRIRYDYRAYAPLLGEPELRLRLRKWTGPITVPLLTLDDGRSIGDSVEIARWSDGQGEGDILFPSEHDAAISRFVALSEKGLVAARALSLHKMREDDEALQELAPKVLRRRLGRMAARFARFGVDRAIRKYGAHIHDVTFHQRALFEVLDELRVALARSPKTPLLGLFTFADIAMAQVIVSVEPPPFGLRLGKASRRAFQHPGLRERYADLVEWRDAIYEAHRPRVFRGGPHAINASWFAS